MASAICYYTPLGGPCQLLNLNHILIRAYSMTYLTGRILTCITVSCQKPIHDPKPFCEFEVYQHFQHRRLFCTSAHIVGMSCDTL